MIHIPFVTKYKVVVVDIKYKHNLVYSYNVRYLKAKVFLFKPTLEVLTDNCNNFYEEFFFVFNHNKTRKYMLHSVDSYIKSFNKKIKEISTKLNRYNSTIEQIKEKG